MMRRLSSRGSGPSGAIWITSYGRFCSQLPQLMPMFTTKTSPFALRCIASNGQSLMHHGFSQCRHGGWYVDTYPRNGSAIPIAMNKPPQARLKRRPTRRSHGLMR